MSDLNVVMLSGSLVNEPEKMVYKSRREIVYFVLAVSRVMGDRALTDFFRVVVKGDLMDRVLVKLSKGVKVVVEGYLLNVLRGEDCLRKSFHQDVVLRDFHLL